MILGNLNEVQKFTAPKPTNSKIAVMQQILSILPYRQKGPHGSSCPAPTDWGSGAQVGHSPEASCWGDRRLYDKVGGRIIPTC